MAHSPEGHPNSENPAVAKVKERHRWRLLKSTKELFKWGFGTALAGAGLFFAAHLIAPIIPVTAVTNAVLNYSRAAGKWLLGLGAVLGVAGGVKAAADAAAA